MTMQYYPSNPYNPFASSAGGYDFRYGGGGYGWDPRAGYVPQVGGYGNPYGNSPPIVNQYVSMPRPPQPVGQQYINTAQSAAPVAKVAPVQAPEDYLKAHKSDQARENWGDSQRAVAADAPEGVKRNLLGLLDWATFGVGDFDRRGNLYGGVHKPGLRPGSGYGGIMQPQPQPKPPEADKQPNQPLPDDPRTTATGQLKHLGMNTVLGKVHQYLDNDTLQRANDRAFNNYIRTKQWLDPNTINFLTAQQMTPYGKSKLLSEATDRTATLTGAATDAATRKRELREGLLALKTGSIGTATAGLNRTYAPGIG